MKFLRCKVIQPHNLTPGMAVRLTYDQWERRRHLLEPLSEKAKHIVGQRLQADGKTPIGMYDYKILQPVIFKAGEQVYLEESIMKSKAMPLYYEDQDAPKEQATPAAAASSSQAQESEEQSEEQSQESSDDAGADESEEAGTGEATAAGETEDYSNAEVWTWRKLKAEVEARGGVWTNTKEAIEFLILDDQTRADGGDAGGATDETGAQE